MRFRLSAGEPVPAAARPSSGFGRFARLARFAVAAIGLTGGCGRAEVPRAAAVEASPAPSDVVFYAHVLYGGDDVYLVEDKWYRPGANGWVVFTEEPPELDLLRRALNAPHTQRATIFGF